MGGTARPAGGVVNPKDRALFLPQQGMLFMSRPFTSMFPFASLMAAALALYGGSARSHFVFDDYSLVLGDQPIQQGLDLRKIFSNPPQVGRYRPVRRLSFALDFKLWGPAAGGFHLTNVILHGVNACLVFVVIQRLAGLLAAWCGAVVFLCHPVQSESVLRISGRGDLLVVLFGLAAVLVVLRCGRARRDVAGTVVVAVMLGAAAALSKDTGFAVPFACLPIFALAAQRPGRREVWFCGKVFAAVTFVAGLAVVLTGGVPGTKRFWGGNLARTSYLASDVFSRYIRLLVWPTNLRAVHWPATPRSAFEPCVLAGIVLTAAVVAALWLWRRRSPLAAAGLTWFAIALLPVLNFIPFERKMAEHLIYLPMVGIACCAAGALGTGTARRSRLACVLTFVAATFSLLASNRGTAWANDLSLWRDTVRKSPHAAVVYMNLGNAYARQGRYRQAVACYKRAARRSPRWGRVYVQMASAYRAQARHAEAAAALEKATTCGLHNARISDALALAYQRAGQAAKAAEAFERAIREDPTYAVAHYNFGSLLLDEGKTEDAARHLRAATQIVPSYAEAWQNLGTAYATLKQYDKASACCERAVRLKPSLWQAHLLLALMDYRKGKTPAAIERLKRAIRLRPDVPQLRAELRQMSPKSP